MRRCPNYCKSFGNAVVSWHFRLQVYPGSQLTVSLTFGSSRPSTAPSQALAVSLAGPGVYLTAHVRTPQDSQQLFRPRTWWESCTCCTVSFSMAPSQIQTQPAIKTAMPPTQSRLPFRVYVSSIVLLFLTCLPSR